MPEPLPDFITVVLTHGWRGITEGRVGRDLGRQALPAYLPKQRWFSAKDRTIRSVKLEAAGELRGREGVYLLTELDVAFAQGTGQRYFLPLAAAWGEENLASGSPLRPYTLAQARRGPSLGALYDATHSDGFVKELLAAVREGRTIAAAEGEIRCQPGERRGELELTEDATVRRLGAEQSNSSVLVGDRVIVKTYRRLEPGIHPEIEIGRFLTDVADFRHTPPLLGSIERVCPNGQTTAYAAFLGFVANQGDGWRWTLDHLDRELEEARLVPQPERAAPGESHELFLTVARLIGQRTAEMHRALATPTDDPAFAAEPVTQADLEAWLADTRAQAARGFAALEQLRAGTAETLAAEIDAALALRPAVEAEIASFTGVPEGLAKTRLHGDYHLGQLLVAKGDIMILDFEGEPLRSLEERRAKGSPAKDVAGMLRSFDYAAWAGVFRFAESDPAALEQLLPAALGWRSLAQAALTEGYREAIGDAPSWPADKGEADRLVRLFTIQKIFYEVAYEAANRPAWLRIPLSGILSLFGNDRRQEQ